MKASTVGDAAPPGLVGCLGYRGRRIALPLVTCCRLSRTRHVWTARRGRRLGLKTCPRRGDWLPSGPLSSTHRPLVPRFQYLLTGALRVHHDHLEEILEVDVEKLDQCLAQLRAWPACPGLECRNIVLANAQVVRQLALCQALLLAHRPQPRRSNLDIHLGIITRTRIFVKTCLQKGLTRVKQLPSGLPAVSSCLA